MPFIVAFDAGLAGLVYDLRLPIAIATGLVVVIGVIVAHRLGWFATARRHPGRTAVLAVVGALVMLPVAFYTISPLFIRSTLVEDAPVAVVDPSPSPAQSGAPGPATTSTPSPTPARSGPPAGAATPVPSPTPFLAVTVATGEFTGTDDFHYGSGTASIIETSPGRFSLRFEAFSVRNGPDLFVYLSPDAGGYEDGALELGRLKATDGSFNYQLPAGTDPADFASALIWCKQFAHLFALAPLSAG